MQSSAATISAIHRSSHQMVIATTGGGASVIGELLRVPGGSASVLEAVVPYSWNSLVQWIGGAPDQACSDRTARAMAMASFLRARQLADASADVTKLLGIGCTASLASDRPKRGAHRFHIAVQRVSSTESISVELVKGRRSRAEEEAMLCNWLVNVIAAACGVAGEHALVLSSPGIDDTVQRLVRPADPAEQQLLLGELNALRRHGTDCEPAGEPVTGPRYVLPGAFNPIHAGHRQMAAWTQARFGLPVEFELSIENVAKPPLDYIEIAARLQQFQADEAVWLTRAPSFVRKSELFPGATFVVGIDTIVRVADPKFAGSPEARTQEIATIAKRGCRFLVFGRTMPGQQFLELESVDLPPALRAICQSVPQAEFRADISSTELRRQQEQQQQ